MPSQPENFTDFNNTTAPVPIQGKIGSDFQGGLTWIGGSMEGEGKSPMDTYSAPTSMNPGVYWNAGEASPNQGMS
jgi:hypothetical protein